jgi:hypothetical protein
MLGAVYCTGVQVVCSPLFQGNAVLQRLNAGKVANARVLHTRTGVSTGKSVVSVRRNNTSVGAVS